MKKESLLTGLASTYIGLGLIYFFGFTLYWAFTGQVVKAGVWLTYGHVSIFSWPMNILGLNGLLVPLAFVVTYLLVAPNLKD